MVSEEIKNLVQQNKHQDLVKALVGLLRKDRWFAKEDFNEAWNYVKSRMPDFGRPFDGKQFADEGKWNTDYLADQIGELEGNFCQERIDHIRNVSQKVLEEKRTDAAGTAEPSFGTADPMDRQPHESPKQKAVDVSFLAVGNPQGLVSDKLKQDVREKHVRHIVNDLLIIIHNDRGLYTSEFADSLSYVRAAGLNVEAPFDGGFFSDESQWNQDYWAEQMTELRFNFCEERIAHVRDIGRKLWPKPIQHAVNPNSDSRPRQQTSSSRQEQQTSSAQYRQQNTHPSYGGSTSGNFIWKVVGGVVVVIFVLGAILFSGRE